MPRPWSKPKIVYYWPKIGDGDVVSPGGGERAARELSRAERRRLLKDAPRANWRGRR